MLRTPTLWKILALGLIAHASTAFAQQKPSEAPPRLEVIEQSADEPITVTPAKPTTRAPRITEKKEGGRVTEVKVKSGKSSYTMKPNRPAGSALPGDALGSANRPPQWTILEFDLNKKKKAAAAAAAAETANAPPPVSAK